MCCVSSYHHLARKFQQIWTFTEQKPEKRPVGYEDISLVIPLYPTGVLVQGLLGDCLAFTTREPPFTETGKTVHLDILFVGDFKSVYDVNHHFGVYILKTFCQRRFANLRHKRFNRTCPTTSLHFNVVQPNGICQDSSFKLLTLPTTNTAPDNGPSQNKMFVSQLQFFQGSWLFVSEDRRDSKVRISLWNTPVLLGKPGINPCWFDVIQGGYVIELFWFW